MVVKASISFLLGIAILLQLTACLKRVVVNPDSEKIPQADFVEVKLKSGMDYILREVKLYEDYLEGEFMSAGKRQVIRIDFDEIQSVEVVNKDYGKVAKYYLIGGAVVVVLAYVLYQWAGLPYFD
jgi:hypothetical protein